MGWGSGLQSPELWIEKLIEKYSSEKFKKHVLFLSVEKACSYLIILYFQFGFHLVRLSICRLRLSTVSCKEPLSDLFLILSTLI